ncbi:MAG: pyroglutamyl-peptidase I [Chloroflexi bacterium]|nr:pyroglutamyl-peptidase I [Chloroflexota bacterium]
MHILVTGFEPFDGSPVNPSMLAAEALAQTPPPGLAVTTAILPVDRLGGPARLLEALQTVNPRAVVCLGEAGGRAAISIERVAVNLMDYRIPDNRGETVTDQPIDPAGPAAYFSTLPVRAMQEAILAAGIPAELSLTAGAYLCNQVMYTLLHHLAQTRQTIPAGFIHLPSLPQQAVLRGKPMPTLGLETILAGLRAALAVLARQAVL